MARAFATLLWVLSTAASPGCLTDEHDITAELPAGEDGKADSLSSYSWRVRLRGIKPPNEPQHVLPDGTYLSSCTVERLDASRYQLTTQGYLVPMRGSILSGSVRQLERTPMGWPLGSARSDATARFVLLRVNADGPTTVVLDRSKNISFFMSFEIADHTGDGVYDSLDYTTMTTTGPVSGRMPISWDASILYAVAPITRGTPTGTDLDGTFGLNFELGCRAKASDTPVSCRDARNVTIQVP